MSFGFSIGDFIAVGELAFRLYRDCYQIARGAPQAFQLLVNEVSNLSNSLQVLQNEVKDPKSTLVQAGEDRVRMVNDMVKGIGDTLKRLEKVAKKYEVLGSSSKSKHFWVKFKWSVEFSSIDGLRHKLVYHNTMMNLLLTSVGNSSLQRIESSNVFLSKDLEAIKAYISNHQAEKMTSAISPAVSMVDDDIFKETLSAAFMKNAEMTQPWSIIGVNQWIDSGRWWLVLAQMELFAISKPKQVVPLAAYANLIKASWILIDIIACHPQVPFLTASTQAEVRLLSTELKNEYLKISNLGADVPELSELESQDLRIWEGQTTESLLRPRQGPRYSGRWKVVGGEQVLFQRYATCKLQALSGTLPCILLFLVHEDAKSARVVAQNQNALTIMEISFQEIVISALNGCSVTVNGEQIAFTDKTDAETLEVLISTTNFYLFERNVDNANLEDLKDYATIFAVKDDFYETLARLPQVASLNGYSLENVTQRASSVVALSLASQPTTSKRKQSTEQEYIPTSLSKQAKVPALFSWAVKHGHTALVALLLSESVTWSGKLLREADPDEDRTPLLQGTMRYINFIGSEETAQLLLDSCLGGPSRDELESEAQLESAKAGLELIIRLLLSRNEALKNKKLEGGNNALHIAAANGHTGAARELLELGWDVDAKGFQENTPLMAAIFEGSQRVIGLLLDKGANVNAKNILGLRATHAALESNIPNELVHLILRKAFEAHLPSQLPQLEGRRRRAEVSIKTDQRLQADVFVDSYYASLDTPSGGIRGRQRKHWNFYSVFDDGARKLGIKFGILFHAYPDANLNISLRLSPLTEPPYWTDILKNKTKRARKRNSKAMIFRIVNGGEFSVNYEACLGVHSFTIATDPNAELVEPDYDSKEDSVSQSDFDSDTDHDVNL